MRSIPTFLPNIFVIDVGIQVGGGGVVRSVRYQPLVSKKRVVGKGHFPGIAIASFFVVLGVKMLGIVPSLALVLWSSGTSGKSCKPTICQIWHPEGPQLHSNGVTRLCHFVSNNIKTVNRICWQWQPTKQRLNNSNVALPDKEQPCQQAIRLPSNFLRS